MKRFTHFLLFACLALCTAAAAAAQTLTSDKADYAPGETATLTGAGFIPNESVTLQVLHADGTPSTGEDHQPWTVTADGSGGFTATWVVCTDDCVGALLEATAVGQSGLRASVQFTDASQGTGVVTVASVGGSCVSGTPPSGGGPFNWEVQEGGTYTMTITGVTECPSSSAITVFAQGSGTGNFCFNLTGGGGTYSGTFTMPNPACNTYPLSYKCGANAPCSNANTFDAKGPGGATKVHLRSSTFGPGCSNPTPDTNCGPSCTPPSIQCPPDKTLQCGDSTDPTNTGTATVTGNCDAHIVGFSDAGAGGCTGRDIDRTWTATNSAGQTVTCVQHIRFVDTTPPVFDNCPTDDDLGCNPASIPGCDPTVTATDNCGPATVSCVASPDEVSGCKHTRVITYTARDGCGNTSTCVQRITWTVDTTKPVFDNCPTDRDLGCNPTAVPDVDPSVSATDNCGTVKVVGSSSDNVTGCVHVRTITYTATDDCGNEETCVQHIRWIEDTTPPEFPNCPADRDLGCNPPPSTIPVCDPTLAATDNCGPATVSCEAVDSQDGCKHTRTITYTATDGCKNVSRCVQVITWTVDTQDPVFVNCPQNRDLGCNPTSIPDCESTVTATDDCGTPAVTCTSSDAVDGCKHTRTITYTATDGCGKTATCVQVVTWTEDTTPPTFDNCPTGDVDLGCNPTEIPGCDPTVAASDNCGPATVTCDPSDAVEGCVHTRTLTYTATDGCGNTATCVQHITWVEDTEPPVFDNCPADADIGCNPRSIPECDLKFVTATDNCSRFVKVTCRFEDSREAPAPKEPPSPKGKEDPNSCVHVRTITYTATDECGNSSTCVQHITWREDRNPPRFDRCPDKRDLGCNPTDIPEFEPGVTATDDCGKATVSSSFVDVTEGCRTVRTITYVATDECGNTSNCVQDIYWVVDRDPPVFSNCPTADVPLGCNPTEIPGCDPSVAATDECSGAADVTCDSQDTADGCKHTRTLTYTATDGCGNAATCVQHITWTEDTTPPTLKDLPAGGDLGCNPTNLPGCDPNVSAVDNCDESVRVICVSGDVVEDGCLRSQKFTYSATDACGNPVSQDVNYTWKVDTTKPVLANVPAGGELGCNPKPLPACDPNVTASDNCDSHVDVVCTPGPIQPNGCLRSQTFNYSAVDRCGNKAEQNVTYTWKEDTTPPVVTCSNITVTLGSGDACPTLVNFTNVSANDNCDGPVSFSPTSGSFPPGTNHVIVTATDACGNVGRCEFDVIVKTAVCVVKFNDYNANGNQDAGEPGVAGVTFTLNPGGATAVSDANGNACFNGLTAGNYTVSETLPSGWFNISPASQTVTLGCPTTLKFGNVKLGGCGGLTLGFWSNKNGQALETSGDFATLTALCLRNADGSNRDFTALLAANKVAFNSWILSANATNMANMLSAQLAAMQLNVSHGFVPNTALVYAPGCGNVGPGNNFISISDLMTAANAQLCANPVTLSGHPARGAQECLKIALDKANNNLNFIVTPNCPSGSTSTGRNNGSTM